MLQDHKNLGAGVVFVLIALYFGISSVTHLKLGTAFQMGPGFFPLCVAVVLGLFGIGLLVQAAAGQVSRVGTVAWRGLAPILVAPVLFGLLVVPFGLAPSMLVTLLVSTAASRFTTWPLAIGVSAGLTAGCVLIFILGLGLPIAILGPVFGGR